LIRDILKKYGGDEAKMMKALMEQRENLPSTFFDKDGYPKLDSLDANYYKPVTADYLKNIARTLRGKISEKNLDAFKFYDETIGPTMESSLFDTLHDINPQAYKAIRMADENWKVVKESPIAKLMSRDASPATILKTVTENWTEFSETMPPAVVDGMRNYIAKEILSSAEKNGKYNPNTIADGIKKYGEFLDDNQLRLLNETKDSFNFDADFKLESELQTSRAKVKATQEAERIAAEKAKTAGKTPEETLKKIRSIDTPEKLQEISYITGKTPQELFKMSMQEIIERNESSISTKVEGQIEGRSTDFNMDSLNKTIKEIEGSVKNQKMIDLMIDESSKKIYEDLKQANINWEKAKTASTKGKAARAALVLLGTFAYSMGFIWTGGHAILEGIRPSAGKSTLTGRGSGIPKTETAVSTPSTFKGIRGTVKKAAPFAPAGNAIQE
jgi:hypothetical protein